MEAYSILMSVYHKEDPGYFTAAMESMLNQTVLTDDFVIVCDGPLTSELDAILESFDARYPGILNIVRLTENVGIGAAANAGLKHCKNDLVAKMDADDLSVLDRCEKQLRLFEANPSLAICGGYIEEFDQDPNKPFSIRAVPATNAEIRKFTRRRQAFNNMTVMYRRSVVEAVGAYRNLRRSEDYDLYMRILHAGYEAANLTDVLVKARVNIGAYARRASWGTLKGCARSRWYAYRIGYSSLLDVCICVAGELVILLSPQKLQHFIYSRFLREKCQ